MSSSSDTEGQRQAMERDKLHDNMEQRPQSLVPGQDQRSKVFMVAQTKVKEDKAAERHTRILRAWAAARRAAAAPIFVEGDWSTGFGGGQ